MHSILVNILNFIVKIEKLLYNKYNFFGKSIFYGLDRESMVGGNTLRSKIEDIQLAEAVNLVIGYEEYKLRWHRGEIRP